MKMRRQQIFRKNGVPRQTHIRKKTRNVSPDKVCRCTYPQPDIVAWAYTADERMRTDLATFLDRNVASNLVYAVEKLR